MAAGPRFGLLPPDAERPFLLGKVRCQQGPFNFPVILLHDFGQPGIRPLVEGVFDPGTLIVHETRKFFDFCLSRFCGDFDFEQHLGKEPVSFLLRKGGKGGGWDETEKKNEKRKQDFRQKRFHDKLYLPDSWAGP